MRGAWTEGAGILVGVGQATAYFTRRERPEARDSEKVSPGQRDLRWAWRS